MSRILHETRYQLTLKYKGGQQPAKIDVSRGPTGLVRLSLVADATKAVAEAGDCFAALQTIRQTLAREGLSVLCYGASRAVYPTEASRDWSGGRAAYRLTLGQPTRAADIVNIFYVGPDTEVVTVDEQEEFYRTWLASLSKRPSVQVREAPSSLTRALFERFRGIATVQTMLGQP